MALDDDAAVSGSGRKEAAINFLPRKTSAYGDPRYWDERFAAEDHYEWLKEYSHFQHLIKPYICGTHSILELGCGNSRLSEELHAEGVNDITCIDLSSTAVDRMRKRIKDQGLQGIQVIEADMLDLPFESESFDIVIEKGTMDVLYVDSGDPWNPRPEMVSKVMSMLKCVHRVLKPHGIFFSVAFGQPHFRRQLFEASCFTWSVKWETFGEGFHYFFYTLVKGRRSSGHEECRIEKRAAPAISLFHDELDGEDFIFRTTIGQPES